MPEARPLTAIVCDPDAFTRNGTAVLARAAGFDVLAEIAYAVDAAHQTELTRPSLVIILHEQSGLPGLDAVAEIRAAVPDAPPEVLAMAREAREILKGVTDVLAAPSAEAAAAASRAA